MQSCEISFFLSILILIFTITGIVKNTVSANQENYLKDLFLLHNLLYCKNIKQFSLVSKDEIGRVKCDVMLILYFK